MQFRRLPPYESRGDKLLPFRQFIGRVGFSFVLALAIVAVALFLGVLGYRYFAELSWVDSLLNASMILTGMGPVDPMKTTGAKLFASAYALFSGVVFLTSMGIVLSPVFRPPVRDAGGSSFFVDHRVGVSCIRFLLRARLGR